MDWLGEAQKAGGLTAIELAAERMAEAQQDAAEAFRQVLEASQRALKELKGGGNDA